MNISNRGTRGYNLLREDAMKGTAFVLLLGGWAIALAGVLMSDAVAARMVAALIGLATSAGGIFTLNTTHLENAIWKARRS